MTDTREVGTLVSTEGNEKMGKIYPEDFRRKAVELYRLDDDATYSQVAQDMGCSSEAVRNWVAQADIDDGLREDGPTSDEKAELAELRRRNARLEKEVRILKAATAYFASDQL